MSVLLHMCEYVVLCTTGQEIKCFGGSGGGGDGDDDGEENKVSHGL